MSDLRRVAVVGASLAGLRACENLRRLGFGGEIVVIDTEENPFYDRPPLSKQFLDGSWGEERIALRPAAAIEALGLTGRFGRRAAVLDLDARRLQLDDGEAVGFDGLVLACGAAPRPLPTEPAGATMVLRTLEDARRLRAALVLPGRRLVVVGAGFLGLEVAATARRLGAEVIVVEPRSAPLSGVLGDEVGAVLGALHEGHGVVLRLGTGVSGVEERGEERRVALSDGSELSADAVLVAIGARPETRWLEGSGLELDDGVVCDETLVAAAGVVVAGDVARVRPPGGASWRVEHWTNAAEQGAHAAASLLAGAGAAPFASVPYFWSDQFDLKLQAIGTPDPGAEIAVVDGSLEEGRFVACYGRDGLLVAAVALGRPRQLMALRPMLEHPTPFGEALARAARGG